MRDETEDDNIPGKQYAEEALSEDEEIDAVIQFIIMDLSHVDMPKIPPTAAIEEIERSQVAYIVLMRAHDRIFASRSKLNIKERIESCKTLWGLMLELREPSEARLFTDDENMVGI